MIKNFVVIIILLLVIGVRHFGSLPVYKDGDMVRITANIANDVLITSSKQLLEVAGLKIYLPISPEITYGDKIVLEGVVEKGELKNPKIISLETDSNMFAVFRKSVIDFYSRYLPQPEAGLLSGIVLGSKSAIPKDFYNKTKSVGLTHVVVASGTNVTFVVSFVSSFLFLFLARKKAIPFIIFGVVMYLFVSGFQAPLVRAAIMSSTLFLSQEIGRVANTWRVFFLTFIAMLLVYPGWVYDIGFWLSFASTGSLMLFKKKLDDKLAKTPDIIREDLSTTLSAQVGVIPILFIIFRNINIWSPLANVLVSWTVPPLMLLGFVAGITKLPVLLLLCYPMLHWFSWIVNMFG